MGQVRISHTAQLRAFLRILIKSTFRILRTHPEGLIGGVQSKTGNARKRNGERGEQGSIQGPIFHHAGVKRGDPERVRGSVKRNAEVIRRSGKQELRIRPVGVEAVNPAVIEID